MRKPRLASTALVFAAAMVVAVGAINIHPGSADIVPKKARLFLQDPSVIRSAKGVDVNYHFGINTRHGQCVTFKKLRLREPKNTGGFRARGFPFQLCDRAGDEPGSDGYRNGYVTGRGQVHFGGRSKQGRWSAVMTYSIQGKRDQTVPDSFTIKNRYW